MAKIEMEERDSLTLIIVPHNESRTRTLRFSRRGIRAMALLTGGLTVFLLSILVFGAYMAGQLYRLRELEREVEVLTEERAQVVELAAALEEAEVEYERVRRMLGVEDAPVELLGSPVRRSGSRAVRREEIGERSDIPSSWPLVQEGFITQEASQGAEGPHPGIDIAVPQDSYIRAAGSGVVRAAGTDDIYGNYVLISHAEGYESMYGHASQLFVAPGDTVEVDEVIALSGSTGRSTAPHLHFEIRKDGAPIDPLPLLQQP